MSSLRDSAGTSYSVSAVVDGASLGTTVTMDSNEFVVLEPSSASTATPGNGGSSDYPFLSGSALLGYGIVAASVTGVAAYLVRS